MNPPNYYLLTWREICKAEGWSYPQLRIHLARYHAMIGPIGKIGNAYVLTVEQRNLLCTLVAAEKAENAKQVTA